MPIVTRLAGGTSIDTWCTSKELRKRCGAWKRKPSNVTQHAGTKRRHSRKVFTSESPLIIHCRSSMQIRSLGRSRYGFGLQKWAQIQRLRIKHVSGPAEFPRRCVSHRRIDVQSSCSNKVLNTCATVKETHQTRKRSPSLPLSHFPNASRSCILRMGRKACLA